jgi:hypothetical protein
MSMKKSWSAKKRPSIEEGAKDVEQVKLTDSLDILAEDLA